MSSDKMLVSLCVIRIEICDPEPREDSAKMDKYIKKVQGLREPREISIETHPRCDDTVQPILPYDPNRQGSSKLQSPLSREGSEEKNLLSPCSTLAKDIVDLCTTNEISFVSGNPFVEVTKGILHLFKENTLTDKNIAAKRSSTVCLLAVPSSMTCHDLMDFTAACNQDIQCFRIIKDSSPNQYMSLIKFRSSDAAGNFYETFNGAPYNLLEPEIVCQMVFVSNVETADNGLPLSGHTELPACPVCLEKMDESVDGILTILCNHTFHSSCLVKWGDTSCPVCRYAQTPNPMADSHCMECGLETKNNALWICLICGHIGCGRYDQSHAFEHYQDTHHCYAMELGQNRVWDYVSDHWVDRLLQDKEGKMVEGSNKGERFEEKVDSVQLEFTYLLTSQLETQREFFEEKLVSIEQRTCVEMVELRSRIDQLQEENQMLKKQLDILYKEKQSVERKLQTSSTKLAQNHSQLAEEKELRKALQINQESWQTKHKTLHLELEEMKEKKQIEIEDLKEQIRDLMFFLEAQKQIENSAERDEIALGQIIVGPGASSSIGMKSSSRGKGKKDKKN